MLGVWWFPCLCCWWYSYKPSYFIGIVFCCRILNFLYFILFLSYLNCKGCCSPFFKSSFLNSIYFKVYPLIAPDLLNCALPLKHNCAFEWTVLQGLFPVACILICNGFILLFSDLEGTSSFWWQFLIKLEALQNSFLFCPPLFSFLFSLIYHWCKKSLCQH